MFLNAFLKVRISEWLEGSLAPTYGLNIVGCRITLCLLSFGMSFLGPAFAQDRLNTIDERYSGSVYYGRSSHIESASKLPKVIQLNVDGYLRRALGTMVDSLRFSHGQVVNLRKYFKENPAAYKYEWIVPKYDLNYVLADITIGIKSFYIRVTLDEYGQIISSSWPRDNYSDKSRFKTRDEIETSAIQYAKNRGFYADNYIMDRLTFNSCRNRLCWVIKFPIQTQYENVKEFHCLEIDWNNLEVIDVYILSE